MKMFMLRSAVCLLFTFLGPWLHAQAESAAPEAQAAATQANEAAARANAAAAAIATGNEPHAPDLLEHLVDLVLDALDVRQGGNTATHYVISACFIVVALVLRRVILGVVFRGLRRLSARTQTTIDDKLFTAAEPPIGTFIVLVGIFAAFKVLKLTATGDRALSYASTVAFSLTIFWLLLRGLSAVLDHAQEIARDRKLGVAAFMPWIKKTLITVFAVFGVLLIAQSLGADVKAALAGLGLGGLAFALAAQDTLANVFGSIVVAVDQPFKIGEAVKIGANVAIVEDIGLRSTRLRMIDKSLIIIPNKTVAAETIINFSRFTRRRVEQVIGLTYDTTPAQMDEMVEEIKRIILAEPEVDKNSVMVFFRDFSASSLDIWVVYETPDPDFQKSMRLRQRINVAIMRAVEARKLSFAFPTQTVHLAGGVAERLAERSKATVDDRPPSV